MGTNEDHQIINNKTHKSEWAFFVWGVHFFGSWNLWSLCCVFFRFVFIFKKKNRKITVWCVLCGFLALLSLSLYRVFTSPRRNCHTLLFLLSLSLFSFFSFLCVWGSASKAVANSDQSPPPQQNIKKKVVQNNGCVISFICFCFLHVFCLALWFPSFFGKLSVNWAHSMWHWWSDKDMD